MTFNEYEILVWREKAEAMEEMINFEELLGTIDPECCSDCQLTAVEAVSTEVEEKKRSFLKAFIGLRPDRLEMEIHSEGEALTLEFIIHDMPDHEQIRMIVYEACYLWPNLKFRLNHDRVDIASFDVEYFDIESIKNGRVPLPTKH